MLGQPGAPYLIREVVAVHKENRPRIILGKADQEHHFVMSRLSQQLTLFVFGPLSSV